MDNAFKKYLQDFLRMYKIDPNGIDFDRIDNLQSMINQVKDHTDNWTDIEEHLQVIFELYEEGIHIYEDDYKTSKSYLKIKDDWKQTKNNGIMSKENYIERFLLDKTRLLDVYANESIYVMGNPYELDEKECELFKVLTNKSKIPKIETDTDDITDKIMSASFDFLEKLQRPRVLSFPDGMHLYMRSGGLIDRLLLWHFDIRTFPDTKQSAAEICKIIYFFFQLEHTPVISDLQGSHSKKGKRNNNAQYFNLINFLGEPSMENTGYILSKRKRFNGKITDFIKNQLEKEMQQKETSLKEMDDIRKGFQSIANMWDDLLKSARTAIDKNLKLDVIIDNWHS